MNAVNPLPILWIIMTTWMPDGSVGASRLSSSLRALRSWHRFLHYDGDIGLHIADDGSGLKDSLHALTQASGFPYLVVTSQQAHGVGASLNKGFTYTKYPPPRDIFLYAVDDWELTSPLDVTPWVKTLLSEEDIGMIRLGPPHPNIHGKIRMVPEGWVLLLDPQLGGFVFGHRPALYHRRFFNTYGPFDEDCSAMECERLYNLKFCHYTGAGPGVALALPHPWLHVGEAEVGDIDPTVRNLLMVT